MPQERDSNLGLHRASVVRQFLVDKGSRLVQGQGLWIGLGLGPGPGLGAEWCLMVPNGA